MSRERLPRILGLFGVLVTALAVAVATVGTVAQTPATGGGDVTFSKDIAPILQRSCQDCHHADGGAPMSLVT